MFLVLWLSQQSGRVSWGWVALTGILSFSHGCWVGVASEHPVSVTSKYSFHSTSFKLHPCCLTGVTVVLLGCVVHMQCGSIMNLSVRQHKDPAVRKTWSPAQGSITFESLVCRKLLIVLFSTRSDNGTNLFDNWKSKFKKKKAGESKKKASLCV